MALTLLDCCTAMYRKAGVLKAAGRGLSPSEQAEALHIVNSMLDGLKIEQLMFYQYIRTYMNVIANKAEYTVGPGADWDMQRPGKIFRAGYIVPGGQSESEIPMDVFQDYTQFQLIVNKNVVSSLSWVMYYRASLPLGTARIWPVPYRNFQITLYTASYVDEFTDINATVYFPDGFREFLEYYGAVAVHEVNPRCIMLPGVEKRAEMYKSRVKAWQFTPAFIRSDEAAQARPDPTGRWWGAREFPGGY